MSTSDLATLFELAVTRERALRQRAIGKPSFATAVRYFQAFRHTARLARALKLRSVATVDVRTFE